MTTVIPGPVARAGAGQRRRLLPALPAAFLDAVADLYDRRLRSAIHPRW